MKYLYLFMTCLIALLLVIYCSDKNGDDTNSTQDVGLKPSSQICAKFPKCYNNSYPPFVGYDKASCMKTVEKFDDSLIQDLLDAAGDCEQYKSLLMDFQTTEMCKVLQECMDAKRFQENLGGSIESCKTVLKQQSLSLEIQQCVYSAYRNNKNCNDVITCVVAAQSDVGLDALKDTGTEKACTTDTDSYNCEFVCDKFHSCTNRYCPPEAGECTREDCIRGCQDPLGNFTIDLMCCIATTSCEELSKCF